MKFEIWNFKLKLMNVYETKPTVVCGSAVGALWHSLAAEPPIYQRVMLKK